MGSVKWNMTFPLLALWGAWDAGEPSIAEWLDECEAENNWAFAMLELYPLDSEDRPGLPCIVLE